MDKKLLGTYIRDFHLGHRLLELQAKDKAKRCHALRQLTVPPTPEAFDQFKCECSSLVDAICGHCATLGLQRHGVRPEPKCDCIGCQSDYACLRNLGNSEYDD